MLYEHRSATTETSVWYHCGISTIFCIICIILQHRPMQVAVDLPPSQKQYLVIVLGVFLSGGREAWAGIPSDMRSRKHSGLNFFLLLSSLFVFLLTENIPTVPMPLPPFLESRIPSPLNNPDILLFFFVFWLFIFLGVQEDSVCF